MHTPLESMFDTLHTMQLVAEVTTALLLAFLGLTVLLWKRRVAK